MGIRKDIEAYKLRRMQRLQSRGLHTDEECFLSKK